MQEILTYARYYTEC